MKKLNVLLILFAFLLNGNTAHSASDVGMLVLEKGILKLRRAGVDTIYRDIGQKIPLLNLDEVQTGKDSKATIRLTDKNDSVELLSQSFFKIDSVDKEESSLSMSIGKARFMVTKRSDSIRKGRKRFKVRTANAIVGVKGTEFILATGAEETNLLTISGSVLFASVSAPDVEVEVTQNQVSQIRQDAKPTAPVAVPPKLKDSIINADTPKVFKTVTFGAVVSGPAGKDESKKKEEKKEQKPEEKKDQKPEEKKEEPKSEPTASQSQPTPLPSKPDEPPPVDLGAEGDLLLPPENDDLPPEIDVETIEIPEIDVDELIEDQDKEVQIKITY